ncbi:MAG TPA: MBL fold metallo-hydrolase [Anaeromyxobacteraceae bacterium]|jgi:glyoxylase-like metal-dependent hydrolase (beta-lactamase superfamily II)|nr:MBL fold metallo-hydrolase [Anaeromyxobacteraceae bacterium]
MKRLLHYLQAVIILGLALLGGAALTLRLTRGSHSEPVSIAPEVLGTRSAGGVWLFAARVGTKVVLFDAGLDPDGHPVDALLQALKAERSDVTDIFLTHGQADHTGAVHLFPQARVHAGAADVELAAGKRDPAPSLASRLLTLAFPPSPARITEPLTGPGVVAVGKGRNVVALPVPGPTPGSYAYLYQGVLFAGDVVWYGEGRLGPTPRPFEVRPEESRKGILTLTSAVDDRELEVVCTSHGGCTPGGEGKRLLRQLAARL